MSAAMSESEPAVDRRAVLATAAGALLIGALRSETAWAQGRPAAMDAWARDLVGLKDELRDGRIDVLAWHQAVERLNGSVPLEELAAYLDVDALTRAFSYPSLLAETADPVLPAEALGEAGMRGWFVRVFGLRRDGAIIPHVHNNMVSAHLVLSGRFRARTYDRIQDLPDAIVLRPSHDGVVSAGHVMSMSDQRDNGHWLLALEDRSMTFDVGVVGLPASWTYGHEAGDYNMIHVDPTAPPDRDGTIAAPILSFEQAAARFAA